jgi:excisionase family DNA binding protein
MDTTDRITAPVGEFCRLAGIGRSLVYEMIGDGRLDSITIGKRRLIVLDSYRKLIERQRAAPIQLAAPPPRKVVTSRAADRR